MDGGLLRRNCLSLSVCPPDVCPFPRDAVLPMPRCSPPSFRTQSGFGVSPGHGSARPPWCGPTERLYGHGSSAGSCVGRICHSPFALAVFFFSFLFWNATRVLQRCAFLLRHPGLREPENRPSPRSALTEALEG